MPEIKHNFSAGKMNKDLDERLVPNGEYRDAMNIQVRTTSAENGSGDAGTVQNIKGNRQILESIHYESPYLIDANSPNETTIIASTSNEKNNTAYFFAAAPRLEPIVESIENNSSLVTSRKLFIDTIVEVNTGTGTAVPTCLPVAVDKWGFIDRRDGVLWEVPDTINENETWIQFTVLNGDDYRVGMTIKAINEDGDVVEGWGIDADGDGDGTVEIQNILTGTLASTITLYTEQLPVIWSDISFFIFEAPRTLNFDNESIITGINIIDDLLFWTDNSSEPKRINIKKCKEGTSGYTTHTQLFLEDPVDSDITTNFTTAETSLAPSVNNDLKEEHVTVIRRSPLVAPTIHMKSTDREGETISNGPLFWNVASVDLNGDGEFESIQPGDYLGDLPTEDMISAYNADPTNSAGAYDFVDATMFNDTDYRTNDILIFTELTGNSESWFTVYVENTEVTDDGYTVLTLRVLTVNGVLPPVILNNVNTPQIPGSGSWTITLDQKTPLFELKFGRFGVRYKYEDGEYSSFGPWSEVAFLPGRFDYDHKHGYNKGMTNTARELIIKDFIPHQRTRNADVVALDLLYKTTVSPNVYVVKTITRGVDPEWDLFTINPGLNEGLVFGELSITSEMIHKALPSNQLLRSWDNVPRQALGQEIAANRLVFSNYVQGYEIESAIGLKQNLKSYTTPTLENPSKSIKSIRDYKFGMVFGDKYGRETPIIAPGLLIDNNGEFSITDGSVVIEKTFADKKNTFVLEQDWDIPNSSGEPDSWISYVKYFIKETSNEYYNLVMDRWYNAEDGNVWLSFQSADRNKLDEETYLLLKNDHGGNRAVLEKARYKILAIENEAPEFIKRRAQPMGEVEISSPGNTYSLEYMFDGISNPTQTTAETISPTGLMNGTKIAIGSEPWGGFLDGYDDVQGDLEIRIKAKVGDTILTSPTWRLVTYHHKGAEESENPGIGAIRWDKPFGAEADMYERFISQGEASPLDDIEYYLEFREMVSKNQPEFDGKFFVKVEKDNILKSKILKYTGAELGYSVIQSFPIAYINNSEYNPSLMNSQENESMPRRNYKWFTDSTATDMWDENDTGSADVEVAIGTETNYVGLGNHTNVARPPLAADGNPIGGYGDYWGAASYCNGSGTDSDGCHSFDAEFLALGCFDWDGLTDGGKAAWGPRAANGGFGNIFSDLGFMSGGSQDMPTINITDTSAPIVYNRVRETRVFWEWFGAVSKSFGSMSTLNMYNTVGHKVKVFVDGMRGVRTEVNDSSTISDCVADSNGEVVCTEYDGMYYKPHGYESGILSSNSENSENVFSPTVNGEFGRITLSVASKMAANTMSVMQSGWGGTGDEEYELKNAMQTYGTVFRFAKDPQKKFYMIVSEELDKFDTMNHNVHWKDVGDSDTNRQYVWWSATLSVNPVDGETWGNIGNPHYGTDTTSPNGNCEQTTDCMGEVKYTNQNPIYQMENVNGNKEQAGYADGESTFVRAGGFTNDFGNPRLDANNICFPCNRWPTAEDLWTCWREGIRFEFREFDPSSGELVDGGTRGIDPTMWDPRGAICHDGREAMEIQIMEQNTYGGEIVIPVANAACWETEPKEDVDLDIYYEASNAIPMILNSENTPNFAPYKSKVTVVNFTNGSYDSVGLGFVELGSAYVSHIGYTKTNSIIGVRANLIVAPNYTNCDNTTNTTGGFYDGRLQTNAMAVGRYLVFEHPDGTKTMSQIVAHMKPINANGSDMALTCAEDGVLQEYQSISNITETLFKESETATGFYKIDSDVWKFPIELGWFNCYTWGNGVESDRIRDDYNAPQLDNGVKVSTTFLDYGRERRGSGMIYSGLYNSTSGVNNLNEFNMAEKITKDLNPTYGSIQRIKTRDTDVVVLTEDKILKVTTNKDALYNADGNPQLLASNRVLGTAIPFGGDYGISNNPESLSWDQYRLYFTDMQRGAVLRLSQNGITPISNVGMKTWFRDNLKRTDRLLGTWDPVNGEYNITLSYANTVQENDTTISFNEGSKGWVSFKSFTPQAAVSVGGKYITAISAGTGTTTPTQGVWEHHVDITKADSNADNFGKTINRNVFYATDDTIQAEGAGLEPYHTNSSITVLFNDMPSAVKAFRAVNYEGSQSRVVQFANENGLQADGSTFTNLAGGVVDGEYYNLSDVDGWWVSSIVTDLSSRLGGDEDAHDSSIIDFKNKEGKWFNKITGANRTTMEDQDLNEFSVQGLGRLGGIGAQEQINININSDFVDDSSNTLSGDGSTTN